MQPIAHSIIQYKWLRERVLSEYDDVDEETLADTLEGLSDLDEMIVAVVRAALDDEAYAEGLRGRIKAMQCRLERIAGRARKRRQIACEAMAECDIRKITACDVTLSLRPGMAGLVVTDEAALPESYWKPQPPKLDRRGLHEDLKRGAAVEGASLSNPTPVLSVRAK